MNIEIEEGKQKDDNIQQNIDAKFIELQNNIDTETSEGHIKTTNYNQILMLMENQGRIRIISFDRLSLVIRSPTFFPTLLLFSFYPSKVCSRNTTITIWLLHVIWRHQGFH